MYQKVEYITLRKSGFIRVDLKWKTTITQTKGTIYVYYSIEREKTN